MSDDVSSEVAAKAALYDQRMSEIDKLVASLTEIKKENEVERDARIARLINSIDDCLIAQKPNMYDALAALEFVKSRWAQHTIRVKVPVEPS